ncbi:Glycosyltransferase involved in cell wall bisynthesis [Methylobacterium sp. UNC300MFChir4.1]|uniref:glycosyltransferase n=1 Tax=Methylobacterium sp. UNC300MFChir4.1 TaxID=1502747 RepID=UPI0008BD0A37|nr:glycosyltransferase [Methylobacterium sp. UNC300MFChir4.1]SEO69567.1 Glycosyltransferase involved in cell wall bisynthesis [Methylobacterium sp. UNC300MFChir4.1]
MHVVILAEFAAASGGAEKVALESARGLAEAGLGVTYIQAIPGPVDPLLDHAGIRRIDLGLPDIWSLGAARAAAAGIWHAAAARRLAAALAGLAAPPDCIHLHQWTRTLSPAIVPVLSETGVPLVVTLHDYALACPNGVYYRFDRAEPCGLTPLSAACLAARCDPRSRVHKAVRVARAAALRQVVGRASRRRPLHVVHVCDASRQRLGALLGGYALTHHRIDNPVRLPEGPAAEPARGDAVAYVGRLTREKGADLVADAARAAGLPALFIGAGPLEAELRARDGVEVIGWQRPEAVWATLRARARALAAPSRWYETGPLTVYEALAAGIPVVASDRSGAAEKVRHGRTGFVVAPEIAPLAEAFAALRDDALAAALGAEARRLFRVAPMGLAAHTAALRALYAGLAESAAGAMQHPPALALEQRS